MKKIISIIAIIAMTQYACKKKDTTTPDDANANTTTSTTSGSGATGFTPPTTNYYKIDDSTNTVSADIVQCNMSGDYTSLSKNFTSINIQPAQLTLSFDSPPGTSDRQIRNQINEGGYKIFTIDTVNYKDNDKMRINLNVAVYGANSGTYYYLATGKLYVSKKNNKLRFTTQGKLTVKGKKYLGTGYSGSIYTRTLEFSFEEGAQF